MTFELVALEALLAAPASAGTRRPSLPGTAGFSGGLVVVVVVGAGPPEPLHFVVPPPPLEPPPPFDPVPVPPPLFEPVPPLDPLLVPPPLFEPVPPLDPLLVPPLLFGLVAGFTSPCGVFLCVVCRTMPTGAELLSEVEGPPTAPEAGLVEDGAKVL